VIVAGLAEALEEAALGRDHPHVHGDRLHDDGCDLFAVRLECLSHRIDVVVRNDDRVCGRGEGDPGRIRQPECRHT
jgi:hypothetical protein